MERNFCIVLTKILHALPVWMTIWKGHWSSMKISTGKHVPSKFVAFLNIYKTAAQVFIMYSELRENQRKENQL